MIKQLINHHIHSTGSDGSEDPEEIIILAIKNGFNYICFADHYFRPNNDPWGKDYFSQEHINKIKNLQEKYKDKIEIGFGVEIDWMEGFSDWARKELENNSFDFILGSVHLVKNNEGKFFAVNAGEEVLKKEIGKLGEENYIKRYFKQIRSLAKSNLVDCIAHIDLIKAYNKDKILFDGDCELYRLEVLQTLDTIKENNMCMEINTSGLLYPCKEVFPSKWILEEAKKRDIPLTIGTDHHGMAHGAKIYPSLDLGLDEIVKLLKEIGYKHIVKFKNRKRISVLL